MKGEIPKQLSILLSRKNSLVRFKESIISKVIPFIVDKIINYYMKVGARRCSRRSSIFYAFCFQKCGIVSWVDVIVVVLLVE